MAAAEIGAIEIVEGLLNASSQINAQDKVNLNLLIFHSLPCLVTSVRMDGQLSSTRLWKSTLMWFGSCSLRVQIPI
jgi:hypothetical protein